MFVLGLTGSIGMGKSTVSDMFRKIDIPVLDSDATVHALYSPGGGAVEAVRQLFPSAIVDGGVDRQRLSKLVVGNEEAMKKLEAAVHPLVTEKRHEFLERAALEGHRLAVLDIPLLYETGSEKQVDAVAVVSAGADCQRQRVLARPGMTAEKFESILARQVPDRRKREMADYIIDTGKPLEETEADVRELVSQLLSRSGRGGPDGGSPSGPP